MKFFEVTGTLTSTRMFKTKSDNCTRFVYTLDKEEYTVFNMLIEFTKKVTLTYYMNPDPNYCDQKMVHTFKYGDYVTESFDSILKLNCPKLTIPEIKTLIKKYGLKLFEIIDTDPDKIRKECSTGIVDALDIYLKRVPIYLKTFPTYRLELSNKDKKLSDKEMKEMKECREYLQLLFKNWNVAIPSELTLNKIICYFKGDFSTFEAILHNNVYILCNEKVTLYGVNSSIGMSFKSVDTLAITVFEYDTHNSNRIFNFLKCVWSAFDDIGVLYCDDDMLKEFCNNKAFYYYYNKLDVDVIKRILVKVNMNGYIYLTTKYVFNNERFIERVCKILIDDVEKEDIIYAKMYVSPERLNDDQIEAIHNGINFGISIITGGPGTGKTHVIGQIIRMTRHEEIIFLLAPTGAAVERIKQVKIHHPGDNKEYNIDHFVDIDQIKTIHSFNIALSNETLTYYYCNDRKTQLKHKEKNIEELTLIIDEMSMVGSDLFASLLRLVDPILKLRLILVGDKNQLSSINGGNVLNDLIQSDEIKCTTLTQVYRTNCEDIINNSRLALDMKDLQPKGKLVCIHENNREKVPKIIEGIIDTHKFTKENCCIISPVNKKDKKFEGIGAMSLNERMRDILNPVNETILKTQFGEFKIGDKVMFTQNIKEREIYNGTVLYFTELITNFIDKKVLRYEIKIDEKKNVIICKIYDEVTDDKGKTSNPSIPFNDNEELLVHCEYSDNRTKMIDLKKDEIMKLIHAYAISVHKSQGQGFDNVIIVLHKNMGTKILSNKLLYTAITRTKNMCIIINDNIGLRRCQMLLPERITTLFKEYENH